MIKKKILITSINGPIAYELVKKLKNFFYVIGSDCQPNGLGKKICDEFYISPKGEDKNFLKFLNKIEPKVNQIFLYADEEIYNLSKNRYLMEKVTKKTLLSPHKTIKICNNKSVLRNHLKKFINFPKNYNNKIIIKPRIGRGSKNQLILKDYNKKYFNFFNYDKNFIVEEFVNGAEFTVDCIFDYESKLIFALPRERIIKSNVSVVGRIKKSPKILSFINKIAKHLKFNGIINIQVIVDSKGKIFLTDINPRISGSIIFSIKSGFNPFRISNNLLNNKKVLLPKKVLYEKILSRYWKTY